jgi:hypothetical protein
MSRNLIDLWMYATNTDFVNAISQIEDWLGIPKSEVPIAAEPTQETERKLIFPLLEKPTRSELGQLSELRSISIPALRLAVDRGFLWTYRDRGEKCRCWLITDSGRKSAIARRLDGIPWQCNGSKTKTLKGSWGHYPIGIADAADYPCIGLCEGSPDFLALFDFILLFGLCQYIAPVCMSGVRMRIPESLLPRFAGKRVRIFIHDDHEGWKAANCWASQLSEVAEVDGYLCGQELTQKSGKNVEDLNDLLQVNNTSWSDNLGDIDACWISQRRAHAWISCSKVAAS